jgi:hypothetical protein
MEVIIALEVHTVHCQSLADIPVTYGRMLPRLLPFFAKAKIQWQIIIPS